MTGENTQDCDDIITVHQAESATFSIVNSILETCANQIQNMKVDTDSDAERTGAESALQEAASFLRHQAAGLRIFVSEQD